MRTPFFSATATAAAAALVVTAFVSLVIGGCGDEPTSTAPPAGTPATSAGVDGPATIPTADGTQPAAATAVPADNSGRNVRDDGSTLTPLDQGMSATDLAITRAVRQAVVANKGISINGQNVKIISKDGVVTLRGPVATAGERSTIVGLAEAAPEVKAVVNHLEVAP